MESKEHLCKYCGYQTDRVGNLNRHIREIHGNVQNSFTCDLCEKVFKRKDVLNIHKLNVNCEANGTSPKSSKPALKRSILLRSSNAKKGKYLTKAQLEKELELVKKKLSENQEKLMRLERRKNSKDCKFSCCFKSK